MRSSGIFAITIDDTTSASIGDAAVTKIYFRLFSKSASAQLIYRFFSGLIDFFSGAGLLLVTGPVFFLLFDLGLAPTESSFRFFLFGFLPVVSEDIRSIASGTCLTLTFFRC